MGPYGLFLCLGLSTHSCAVPDDLSFDFSGAAGEFEIDFECNLSA